MEPPLVISPSVALSKKIPISRVSSLLLVTLPLDAIEIYRNICWIGLAFVRVIWNRMQLYCCGLCIVMTPSKMNRPNCNLVRMNNVQKWIYVGNRSHTTTSKTDIEVRTVCVRHTVMLQIYYNRVHANTHIHKYTETTTEFCVSRTKQHK